MGSSVRSCGREAPGPGVRRAKPDEELDPGVAYLRSRAIQVSPSEASEVGALGMTSAPTKEVFHQRSSQRGLRAKDDMKPLCHNGFVFQQ